MNFNQIINYLMQTTNYELKMDFSYKKLESESSEFTEFLKASNLLENLPPSVHIAGSKGKGTIAFALEQIVLANKNCFSNQSQSQINDKKFFPLVYTSPHFEDLTERIRFAGRDIPKEVFALLVTELIPLFEKFAKEKRRLTFFEMTTALFLKAAEYYKPDVLIIETGLGGRLDSTNSVPSQISVITTIEYEHTKLLGDTLSQIAYEKAGIIKDNQIFILAPQFHDEVHSFFAKFLHSKNLKEFSILRVADKLHIGASNLLTVQTILKKLPKINPKFQQLADKAESIRLPKIQGRQQKLTKKLHRFIIDGAHTHLSILALKNALTSKEIEDSVLIFGLNQDKFQDQLILSIPPSEIIIASGFESPRCVNPRELAQKLFQLLPNSQIISCPNSQTSFIEAVKLAKKNLKKIIIVTGSFYLAGEIYKLTKLMD